MRSTSSITIKRLIEIPIAGKILRPDFKMPWVAALAMITYAIRIPTICGTERIILSINIRNRNGALFLNFSVMLSAVVIHHPRHSVRTTTMSAIENVLKNPVITLLNAGLFKNSISQIQRMVIPVTQIRVQK
jgi:hypothetical protein